jgi:predicted transcriptional regulator
VDDLELISDGNGLAVIGSPGAVDRFLTSQGLPSQELGLPRLGNVLSRGAGTAQAASEMASMSGRWVQLTKESAELVNKFDLMKGSSGDVARAVVTDKGKIKGILEFAKTPGSFLTNPARLAGAAGLMAQLAMQQTMDEITDYLAVIDQKVEDVLRAQKDAVLADMIGSGLVIDDALVVREHTGRVSETTWSTVQAEKKSIATTQAYALRRLDALAEKLERTSKVGDLAKAASDAVPEVQEWLAVLARCFQLQDALGVLELDRVLDAADLDELDRHRRGLQKARESRLELIERSTERLLGRMDAAAGRANAKVLLNPTAAPRVVRSSERAAVSVDEFHTRLGIESGRESWTARRWVDAAGDVRDRMVETGAEGIGAARRGGSEALVRARSMTSRLSDELAERTARRRADNDDVVGK